MTDESKIKNICDGLNCLLPVLHSYVEDTNAQFLKMWSYLEEDSFQR